MSTDSEVFDELFINERRDWLVEEEMALAIIETFSLSRRDLPVVRRALVKATTKGKFRVESPSRDVKRKLYLYERKSVFRWWRTEAIDDVQRLSIYADFLRRAVPLLAKAGNHTLADEIERWLPEQPAPESDKR